MKRLAVLGALLCALVLAACGGGHHKSVPAGSANPAHCIGADAAMQCKRVAPSPNPNLLLAPVFAYGIDFAWGCYDQPGARFGASYLSTDRTKNWTAACIARYRREGKQTVVVWETYANRALSGFAGGQWDAQQAVGQAAALGFPSSQVIYFAVDFDSSSNPWAVLPYFRGVRSVLPFYRVGAYGGLATIRGVFNAGLADYGWQTSAWSWGIWDPRAQIQQYAYPGAYDWDRAVYPEYGQTPAAWCSPVWGACPNPNPAPRPIVIRPKPKPLPVCVHRRESAKACASARAEIASDERAQAASARALSRAVATERTMRGRVTYFVAHAARLRAVN